MKKVVLKVKGMHCASCSVLIDKLVGREPGVFSVATNYAAEKMVVEFDESKITLERIDELVNKLGYDLIRPDERGVTAEEEERKEARQIEEAKRRVIASLILSSPIVVYYMLIHMFNLQHVHQVFGIDLNYLYWVLSTPIQFVIGWPFYRNAFTAIRVGSANMDVLVVLGTSAAYFYSTIGFLFFNIDHPFWESSAALLSFILLGRYIEVLAKGRAGSAIKELLKLEAKEAHRLTIDHKRPAAYGRREEEYEEVPIVELAVGDILLVKPGEKIPVDGIVLDGRTHVDEKVVTGESFPVSKEPGDEVIGATVNEEGLITFRATKVGKETLLNQIIRMVEEAQARRAPIQDLVDKISEYFVPAVIVIAVAVFVGWYFFAGFPFRAGLVKMIAVLVISCPCAMGLATPTALVVGIGRAARYGIILKGGAALEKAYKVGVVAFDKTGTITIGKPEVTDFIVINQEIELREVLYLASSLESGSEHPIARAIVEKGKILKRPPAIPFEFKAVPGMGVGGMVDRKRVEIGNLAYLEKLHGELREHRSELERLQSEAKTVVLMFVDRKPTAIIALADTVKPYAKEAIAALKAMGKEVVMITGDNEKTAHAIGMAVGIDRMLAEVLPQDKARVIEKIQKEGKTVAMVGDGINDSPALAQADIGVAIGSGTDVAIETGEVILVRDDLRDVVTAIQLSGKVMRKIWQNLFWAFIYNVIAIPIAGGIHLLITQSPFGVPAPWIGVVTDRLGRFGSMFSNLSQATLRPEIAGFAMALSSISVVLNSLLLRRYVPPIEKT